LAVAGKIGHACLAVAATVPPLPSTLDAHPLLLLLLLLLQQLLLLQACGGAEHSR
jgi:hypothetical protein